VVDFGKNILAFPYFHPFQKETIFKIIQNFALKPLRFGKDFGIISVPKFMLAIPTSSLER
jgi:hypothetical protein